MDLHQAVEILRAKDITWNDSTEIATAHAGYDFDIADGNTHKLLRQHGVRFTPAICRSCKKIKKLIAGRLLEALSSPLPYLREWGRLIIEQQQRWKQNERQKE